MAYFWIEIIRPETLLQFVTIIKSTSILKLSYSNLALVDATDSLLQGRLNLQGLQNKLIDYKSWRMDER
jgi:hypothetical protein